MSHDELEAVMRSADLDNLPVAVAHVDDVGTIVRANAPLAELLGTTVDDIEGRNLLEFGADDPARYLEMLTFSSLVTAPIMGPVAATYHAPDGSIRRTSLWTRDCREDPNVGAFVCVLTPEEPRGRMRRSTIRSPASRTGTSSSGGTNPEQALRC